MTLFDYRYRLGGEPRLLDVIELHLRGHQPKSYQPENWLIDPDTAWEPCTHLSWDELAALADHPATLWRNGDSTATGRNDRVCLSRGTRLPASLYLLELKTLELCVGTSPSDRRKQRRVQARFTYQGVPYAMWLTDRATERVYLTKPDGDYPVGPCFVTVSLSEPFYNDCYKLLAAVITPRPLT